LLTTLASVFVVPPISLLMLCVVGFLLPRRWRRVRRLASALGLFGLVALALPVTAKALMVSLERDLPRAPDANRPPRAIIVLGGDVMRSAGPPPTQDIGPLSMERVRTAARLWRSTHLPILVTGGGPGGEDVSVAGMMARTLREEFGVPVTWVESRAVDTWDNATRSAAILRQENIGAAYLITQPWHMRRGLQSFARFDLALTAYPTQLDVWSGDTVADYIPRVSAWSISYFACHEWIGRLYYAFRR
jgi:uncharacterized SAM-binding protein YcdF (DUF218 family)